MSRKLFCCSLIFAALAFPYDCGAYSNGAEATPPANEASQTLSPEKFSTERYCNDLKDLKFEVSVYPKQFPSATTRTFTSNERTSPRSRFGFFTKSILRRQTLPFCPPPLRKSVRLRRSAGVAR
jgi:hypothetical protein